MTYGSTIFACSHCDAQYTKWAGRCLECSKWGTIVESMKTQKHENPASGRDPAQGGGTKTQPYETIATKTLQQIQGQTLERVKTAMNELDRVLGGGVVPGSLILLGGEPGIGKSTLALQIATLVPSTLYISGEESVEQIKLRADRLRLTASGLQLANATSVEAIIATIEKIKPTLAVVDSIQTMVSADGAGETGSVAQVRVCTSKLLTAAKATNTAILLIGHVTKDGALAGPKTLEHLVDVVLSFEGDRHHQIRLLRGVKNRFGGTDEVGLFDMTETGLVEVTNPSAALLAERGESMPGTVVTCLLEGTRPMLAEIQALINKTVFGYPVRKASGFDLNRLHVLIAVLQRRAGLALAQYDIHVNVVGGITADEPAADLAVCLAVASAYKEKVLGNDLVAFGEVGLGGEVRSVQQMEKRLRECEQLGMKRVIMPPPKTIPRDIALKIIGVKNIQELISHA